MSYEYLSFRLSDDFLKKYEGVKPDWGFKSGKNSLGEITFITKYSRRKDDGTKELWQDTCKRCIEGYYSILKDHCKQNRTPWNEFKAQKAAEDSFERMFTFKWLPPGRGLWMMGTPMVNQMKNSAALQNCAMISTEKLSSHSAHEATLPFVRLMEMSMLGVGVGFDVLGAGNLTLHQPTLENSWTFQIPDSREGWFESVHHILESYFFKNRSTVWFDYSLIRPAGALISTFGGVAAGPGPLMDLHDAIRRIFDGRAGEKITSTDIADLQNLIGKCVVSGNVRRSAEIALGNLDDQEFLDLKNATVNPVRNGVDGYDKDGEPIYSADGGWAYTSNNSVFVKMGDDLSNIVPRIADNGEPGLLYMDLCRQFGRMKDPANNKDWRAAGTNPCGEQTLESYECCTLVETFPTRHEDLDDYKKTLKHAYLYAKAVTLLPTHWAETNEVMQRNRRIGCSMSGVAQFVEHNSWAKVRQWMDEGYKTIQARDRQYSEWLGVRESIKTTSIKPSGTVSLLAGVTPGVHWPTATIYIRRMRFANSDPLLAVMKDAGYKVEKDIMDPKNTSVVEFPTMGPDVRTEREVTMWEKADLAICAGDYWADNQVSVTITFSKDEADQVGALLQAKEGQLKSLSMLPISDVGAYKQMPYETIDLETYNKSVKNIVEMDMTRLYSGDQLDAAGEKFCNNDVCLI